MQRNLFFCARLETTTTTTTLATGRIGRNGSDILDPSDPHTGTSEGTESGLGTRTRGLSSDTTGSTDLDVESGDTDFLASDGDVLSGQHGSVRRGLVTIGLDLHTTGNTGDGLLTGEIGDVNEGIVEGGENVSYSEDKLTLFGVGAEGGGLSNGSSGGLLGGHF